MSPVEIAYNVRLSHQVARKYQGGTQDSLALEIAFLGALALFVALASAL